MKTSRSFRIAIYSLLCPLRLTEAAITVATDGSGNFHSIQAAVDSIPKPNYFPVEIDIKPGTYSGHVSILAGKSCIRFVGKGATPADTVITSSVSSAGGNMESATLSIHASDLSFENLTVQNSLPIGHGQANAISSSGGAARNQFKNVSVLSTQDTLYIKGGPLYFLKCRITGTVDYICGNGPAWFDGCELVFLDRGPGQGGVLTANNCTQNERYGFVFNHCTVTGASNTMGHCWLGRPWGTFSWASVTFLKCKMDGSIAALGWLPWDMTTPDPNARFGEYGTMDKNDSPVNLSQRAGHSQGWNNAAILTDSQASTFNLANVLGSWKPSYAFDGAARHSGTSQRW